MTSDVLKQYIDAHFSERPTEEKEWKYQIRDMLDEFFVLLAFVALFFAIYYFTSGWGDWIAVFGLIGCSAYILRLLWLIVLRRTCSKFQLTPDHFVYSHGLFRQKTETFQLSDIIQMTLRRSIWERIIRTGTIEIRFKTNAGIKKPLVIRGIGHYQEMFDKIDYYRNYHRLVLYFGI